MLLSEMNPATENAPVCILVVEDEPVIRFTIAETLRELDASVIEAATADEAWQFLKSGSPVDVIFTDHLMPGSMTGAQLAAKVREQFPVIKIIVTSAYFSAQEWREPILRKPYKLYETANDLIKLARQNRAAG